MRQAALLWCCIMMLAYSQMGFSQSKSEKPTEKNASSEEPKAPPELTQVSGRLMLPDGNGANAGVAYFVFQSRLLEIPQENPMDAVRNIAEAAVAIDKDGSFTLAMSPGNYALVYDAKAEATDQNLQPGPQSQTMAKRPSAEERARRIEAIKANAAQGLPIKDRKLGEAYVIENRYIRPPVSNFGEMKLGQDNSVKVIAVKEDGSPIDFPAKLNLRGKNGDILEPHPRTQAAEYVFHGVFTQPYEVFATATRLSPDTTDAATTPSLKNQGLVFEGKPLEQKVTVTPSKADGNRSANPREN